MKTSPLLAAVLGCACVGLVSCDDSSDANDAYDGSYNETTPGDVMEETGEAFESFGDLARQEYDQFKASMRENLDDVDERIERVEADLSDLGDDMRREAEEALDDLREQRDELRRELDEAGDASRDAWSDLRSGLVNAWNNLEEASKDAVDRFTDR